MEQLLNKLNETQFGILMALYTMSSTINKEDLYSMCSTLAYTCHNQDTDMIELLDDVVYRY